MAFEAISRGHNRLICDANQRFFPVIRQTSMNLKKKSLKLQMVIKPNRFQYSIQYYSDPPFKQDLLPALEWCLNRLQMSNHHHL